MNVSGAVTLFNGAREVIAAGTTPVYRGVLQDDSVPADAIGSATVTSLKLSITDDATGAVVNNCDAVNILNADRGTLDAAGNITITLLAADTAMLRASDTKETRSLTIDWTWPGPGAVTHVGRRRVVLTIVPMPGD